MPNPSPDLLGRYLHWRRIAEPGFWIGFFCLQAAANSWTVWVDLDREGRNLPFWQPASWEWSSNLTLLALMPAVLWFERRAPLGLLNLQRRVPQHLLASMVYSLVHVLVMVGVRKLVYLAHQDHYDFGLSAEVLAYEYVKDARAYVAILLMVSLYRFALLRWQGEATLLNAPDQGPPVDPIDRPERFLVQKLGREFLLPAAEIEWIQAWGNYVNLHVRDHDYPLRATMSTIEQRLDPRRFVRVHRSYIVNLDFVGEIEPLDSGDARALMRDGRAVPVSRRYRAELRKGSGAGGG